LKKYFNYLSQNLEKENKEIILNVLMLPCIIICGGSFIAFLFALYYAFPHFFNILAFGIVCIFLGLFCIAFAIMTVICVMDIVKTTIRYRKEENNGNE